MTTTENVPPVLAEAAQQASSRLGELETTLRGLSDGDLHLADTEGGWTCAQVVSHITLCALLWIGDLERMRHQPPTFLFRTEVGHDALGAPPPTAQEAADRVASVREALERCLPAVDPAVLDRSVEIATLGTMTVGEWMPLLIGHLTGHADQVDTILRARGVLSA